MDGKSFFIAGGSAAIVANDGCDFRYRAAVETLPVGSQCQSRTDDRFETQFLVDAGTVEFMIGGGTAIAFAGDFVRVRAGIVHGWRNAGDTIARILVRRVSPAPAIRASRVRIDFAA